MGFGKDTEPTNPYTATDPLFQTAIKAQSQANEVTAQGYEAQAGLAMQEAKKTAELVARQARETVDANALNYTSSGVLASEGSPIAVASEIAQRAKKDVQSYIAQGAAQANLYRQQAYLTRVQGKAAILGQQTQYSMGSLSAQVGAVQPGGFGLVAGNMLTSISGGLFGSAFGKPKAASTAPTFNPLAANGLASGASSIYQGSGL